jgi:hypothetical protein
MTACGMEWISDDDTYVDASVQFFPKVEGVVKGDPHFLQMDFDS